MYECMCVCFCLRGETNPCWTRMGHGSCVCIYCCCHHHHTGAVAVCVGSAQSVSIHMSTQIIYSKVCTCTDIQRKEKLRSLATVLPLQEEIKASEEAGLSHHLVCQKFSSFSGRDLKKTTEPASFSKGPTHRCFTFALHLFHFSVSLI